MLSTEVINRINSYKSHQNQWERLASIRSKPRRILSDELEPVNYYSISRQPMCAHPHIISLGAEVKDYILTQSFYKYMNDIANIEKDIINRIAYNITKDNYFIKFSTDIKQDALSIIIDESYHAFVAIDFMSQVSNKTQISSLDLPTETELSLAISALKQSIPEKYHHNFELITVCIAEHALTHDLIASSKASDVSKTFYYVMHDHVLDEGRHAIFFSEILSIFWMALPEDEKRIIGPVLPELLRRYLQSDLQRQFDEKILLHLELPAEKISKVLDETHVAIPLSEQKSSNVVLRQMLALLRKSGVLEHNETRDAFLAHGLD